MQAHFQNQIAATPLMIFSPPPLISSPAAQHTLRSSNTQGVWPIEYLPPSTVPSAHSDNFYHPQHSAQLIHPVVLSYLHPPVSDRHFFSPHVHKGRVHPPEAKPPTIDLGSSSPNYNRFCNHRLRWGDCFHKGNYCKPPKKSVQNLTTTPLPRNFQQAGPLRHFQSHKERILAQKRFLQQL